MRADSGARVQDGWVVEFDPDEFAGGLVAHDRAGQVALPEDLVDIAHLVTAYYSGVPDPENPLQQVVFGTSEIGRAHV